MTPSPGPGWYQDPADVERVRFWDGTAWTHQVAAKPVAAAPVAAPPVPPATPTPPIVVPAVAPAPITQQQPVTPPPRPVPAPPTPAPSPAPIDPLQAAATAATDLSGRPIDPSELPPTTADQVAQPDDGGNPWATAATGLAVSPGYGVPAQPMPASMASGSAPGGAGGYPPMPSGTITGYPSASAYQPYNPQSPLGSGPRYDERYVGFFTALKVGFRKYARFTGRSSRSEFWWWYLFTTLASLLFGVGFGAYVVFYYFKKCGNLPAGVRCTASTTPLLVYAGIILLFFLVIFIPSIGVTVRRLQDTDRNGSWIWLYFATLLLNAIPLAGPFMSLAVDIMFLVWLAGRGTDGPNRFGEPPHEGLTRISRLSGLG